MNKSVLVVCGQPVRGEFDLVAGSAVSYYPALHASRLDPTEALRAL